MKVQVVNFWCQHRINSSSIINSRTIINTSSSRRKRIRIRTKKKEEEIDHIERTDSQRLQEKIFQDPADHLDLQTYIDMKDER